MHSFPAVLAILVAAFAHSSAPAAELPESPQAFRIRQMESGPPYRHVFTASGISCDIGEHVGSTRPILGKDNHFMCPCLTDMGCAMVNPHIDEISDGINPKVLAKAPKGTNCRNAIPWTEAKQNVGRTLVVVGRVEDVTVRSTSGKMITWISVGEQFPSSRRLTLVVWDDSFKLRQPKELEGKFVCAVGKISSYRGSAQIVLRSENEFRVSQ